MKLHECFSYFVCSSGINLLSYFRKNIEVNVIDDEEYEKNETFYVVLGEPKVVKNDEDDDSGAGTEEIYDAEKQRLEELGKPRLGTKLHKAFLVSFSRLTTFLLSGSLRNNNDNSY